MRRLTSNDLEVARIYTRKHDGRLVVIRNMHRKDGQIRVRELPAGNEYMIATESFKTGYKTLL